MSIQSLLIGAYGATSVPVLSTVATSEARAVICVVRAAGSGRASAAAISGVNDISISVRSIPIRSATMPTRGAASPPTPHANPIISDETVAAEIGAIVCAKVTLTGSVDCSRNPPAAIIATIGQASKRGATATEGTEATIGRS